MGYLHSVSNFGECNLATAGIDSASTTLNLASGEGGRFPSPGGVVSNFYVTVWNFTDFPNPALDNNREIMVCTGRSSDALTVQRGQAGTSAVAHNTAGKTYRCALVLTKEMWDLIEARLINFEKSGFYAYRNTSSQSIPQNVDTLVQFNAEDVDLSGEYGHATDFLFTCNKAGFYIVSASIAFSDAGVDNAYLLKLYKNGTGGTLLGQGRLIARNAEVQIQVVTACALAQGDTVGAYARHGDVAARTVNNGRDKTWFTAGLFAQAQRQ